MAGTCFTILVYFGLAAALGTFVGNGYSTLEFNVVLNKASSSFFKLYKSILIATCYFFFYSGYYNYILELIVCFKISGNVLSAL